MVKPYYEQDGIQLFLGDCREVLPTLPTDMVLISDPPYGIGFVKGKSGKQGAYRGRDARLSRHDEPLHGDDAPFDPAPCLRFANVLLWGANHFCHRLPESGRWLAWNKLERLESFDSFSDVEFAWHSVGKVCRIFNYMWKGGLACRKEGENNGRRSHPTQKPLGLMSWCIKQSGAKAGDTILDPYMGSGTTIRAAMDAGLKAVGIELREDYCEVAAKRLEQNVFAWEP